MNSVASRQFLNVPNVCAIFGQVCSERVTQRMVGRFLSDAHFFFGMFKDVLGSEFWQVIGGTLTREQPTIWPEVPKGRADVCANAARVSGQSGGRHVFRAGLHSLPRSRLICATPSSDYSNVTQVLPLGPSSTHNDAIRPRFLSPMTATKAPAAGADGSLSPTCRARADDMCFPGFKKFGFQAGVRPRSRGEVLLALHVIRLPTR